MQRRNSYSSGHTLILDLDSIIQYIRLSLYFTHLRAVDRPLVLPIFIKDLIQIYRAPRVFLALLKLFSVKLLPPICPVNLAFLWYRQSFGHLIVFAISLNFAIHPYIACFDLLHYIYCMDFEIVLALKNHGQSGGVRGKVL